MRLSRTLTLVLCLGSLRAAADSLDCGAVSDADRAKLAGMLALESSIFSGYEK